MRYRVIPWYYGRYNVGYGPNDDEFTVVATTTSRERAEQIARLLESDLRSPISEAAWEQQLKEFYEG